MCPFCGGGSGRGARERAGGECPLCIRRKVGGCARTAASGEGGARPAVHSVAERPGLAHGAGGEPLLQCAPPPRLVLPAGERGRPAPSRPCLRAPAWGYKSFATCCHLCVQLREKPIPPAPAAAPLDMDPETCPCPTGEPPHPACGTERPFTCTHALRLCSRTSGERDLYFLFVIS